MVFTKNQSFEVTDMTDGVVLFDPATQSAHHLNGPATLVWEVAEGRDVAGVVDAVGRVLEVPEAEARPIAESAIAQLQAVGALQG